MTELTEHDPNSPSIHDDNLAAVVAGSGNGSGTAINEASRGVKRQRPSGVEDDDDDEDKPGRERRKIEIKFITDKSRRHITFSKRKAGIMKKAYELSVLTGTQVLLLVVSETGLVYTFTTPKLQPLVTKSEGKNLIQACLNAPEPANGNENGVDSVEPTVESPEDSGHPVPRGAQMHPHYNAQQINNHNQQLNRQLTAEQQAMAAAYNMYPPPNYPMPHPPAA
ncbi:MAG: transcription factor of the MADS box [Trizodia sp. TS-e1964]|nr:MAG: transcription factor of the MADS box [Trizodia sp. TS-e1964]